MFENIESKIKTLAKVVCWAGIVLSFIVGFVFMFNGESEAGIGLIIIIAGGLGSWISSLFIYGFGELIEKCGEIADNTKNTVSNTTLRPKAEDKLAALEKWRAQGLITEEEYLSKRSQL